MKTVAWLAAGMLCVGSFAVGGWVSAQSSPWRPASSDQLNKYAQTHGSLKQIAPIFSQLVLISPPSNFRPVFEHLDNGGQSYIHESVPGSTPKSRTVVKGWRTSNPAWRSFAASLGCGAARCIRTHPLLRYRVLDRSCDKSARA